MTPLDRVLDKLQGVKRNGAGWRALCPAHDDHDPSLGVTEGDDGKVLLTCYSRQCSAEAIAHAIGMSITDLFPPREQTNGHRQIIATYDYTDEGGELLFQVVRFEPKDFRQRRPDGRGGWEWKLQGVRRVLYRLSKVLDTAGEGGEVWVCEGEKDVHAAEAQGVVATTMPGGTGRGWRPEYSEQLRGAVVYVVADRDDSGRQHARLVAADLEGVAKVVQVVEPARGKDLADHIAAGLGMDDLLAAQPTVAEVREEVEDVDAGVFIDWDVFWKREKTAREWMLEPLFPEGRGIAVVAGAKTGKSYLLLYCTAALATGRPILHQRSLAPVKSLYLDYEMTEDDVFDRLEDFGYDEAAQFGGQLFYALHPLTPPLDTKAGGAELLALCERHQIRFLAIDTLGKAVEGDENDADTLRSFYRHTGALLKRAGITWVRADHTGKDPAKGARGTSAKADDVDIVWQLTRTEAGMVAKATHRRLTWVPEEVALAVVDDPVVFRIAPKAWPPGVQAAAAKLDQAVVPVGASRRMAAQMLRQQGISMSNRLIAPAQAWRVERSRFGDGPPDGPLFSGPADHPTYDTTDQDGEPF